MQFIVACQKCLVYFGAPNSIKMEVSGLNFPTLNLNSNETELPQLVLLPRQSFAPMQSQFYPSFQLEISSAVSSGFQTRYVAFLAFDEGF